jgi:hypothetical protein
VVSNFTRREMTALLFGLIGTVVLKFASYQATELALL